jgi:hypothetical protein
LNLRGAKIALPFLCLRLLFQNLFWAWNGDIQTAIIPGLQCWYCQPSQAPYGILWHIISWPLSLGETAYFYTLGASLGDFLAMTLMGGKQILPMYGLLSFWIWLQAPYDTPICWLCLFGLVKWPLVLLGPLGKLPYLAPASTVNFVLQRHYVSTDLQYYGLMGMVFILVLVQARSDRIGKIQMGT